MMKFSKYLLFSLIMTSCSHIFANDAIIGKWKNIDDQTGFSKGIIEIYKESDGSYSGRVHEITPHPGYTPKEICDKCTGADRNKPTIGMKVLRNFHTNEKKDTQYIAGTILDPTSGKLYKGTLNLRANGKRLALRGYIGVELIGRSQTWIRSE